MTDWCSGQLACKRWLETCGELSGLPVAGGSTASLLYLERMWSVSVCRKWQLLGHSGGGGQPGLLAAWMRC